MIFIDENNIPIFCCKHLRHLDLLQVAKGCFYTENTPPTGFSGSGICQTQIFRWELRSRLPWQQGGATKTFWRSVEGASVLGGFCLPRIEDTVISYIPGWWQLKYLFYCSPRKIEEDETNLTNIFQLA